MPRRALADINSESAIRSRKPNKSTFIVQDKENLVYYDDSNLSVLQSNTPRGIPKWKIVPPSPKSPPVLKNKGNSSNINTSSKKKVQFVKSIKQGTISTPVKKLHSTPTRFHRRGIVFEESCEAHFSSPGDVFEDFKGKLSFSSDVSPEPKITPKFLKKILGSKLGTPRGKKTMLFDTPVKERVLSAGLQGLSPRTRKQMHILGKGSFGRVVVGKYKGEKRALKVMKLPTALTREAWALHFDHPNIIRTVDVSQTSPKSEYVLIVMEFVGTDTLQIFIDDQEDLMDLRQCLKFSKELSDALSYCHMRNFIHMDVKPANIVVTPSGVCKLTDFGSCVNLNHVQTPENQVPETEGTIPYMAPEIFRGNSPTVSADIYSLAIVMWQMWTGLHPYSNVDSAEVLIYQVVSQQKRPDAKREPKTDTERDYISLYQKCWDVDLRSRPSANAIAKVCEELSSHLN